MNRKNFTNNSGNDSKDNFQNSLLSNFCFKPDNEECKECSIKDVILCRFTRKEKIGFALGNLTYRILASAIFFFFFLITQIWWVIWVYIILVVLTFLILEPRLLCSHCPFYALEGRSLKCGGLWGMPKIWRYRPEPISRWEQNLMVLIGAIIDISPILGIFLGFIAFFLSPIKSIFYLIGLIVVSILFIGLAYYFGTVLLGDRCKRCPNFSCRMNKVPEEYRRQFLDKNPIMKFAWEKYEENK